jgi:outer membrane receptor protein involved in Fe transport
MNEFRWTPMTAAALLALGALPAAHAADENTETLESITVTATKRASTVQETPISITAVSAEDIAARGLTDFNALAESVAGISMRTAGPGQTEFEMRGLNSSGGNTSMVGFYLDETPLSAPASAQLGKVVIDPNLYDLDHVEVLRGPQGTLYGSSSMGGTVKIVPAAPQLGTFDASGETRFSHTGSGGGLNNAVNAMINLPLGSTAAVRIVASSQNDSGWIQRNVFLDGSLPAVDGATRPANFYSSPLAVSYPGANTTNVDSVRASLLWKPVSNLTITPMLMWQLSRQGGPNAVDVGGAPTYPSVPGTAAHWEIYDTPEPQTDRLGLGSLKVEYQFDTFSLTSATSDWARSLIVSQDGTEETAWAIGIPIYDANGTTTGGLGPSGPTPYGSGVTERDYAQQFSEELRAASTGSGPFQWLGGYFFQKLTSDWSMYSLNPQAGPILGGPNVYVDYQPQTISQNSFFGELSYRILPDLKGTVGLRHYLYNLQQNNAEYGAFTVFGGSSNTQPFYTGVQQGASGTDPKFDLSWNLDKDTMIYGTISKGFRLGGANQPIPVAPASDASLPVQAGNECSLMQKVLFITKAQCQVSPYNALLLQAPSTFASDSVWNYELGEKASFMDRHLEVNASVYLERWKNPQIATNLSGFGLTVNGSDARIVGAEAEVRARLAAGFGISANLGYTNATFNSDNLLTGYPSGMAVPDIPKFTGSFVLSNRQRIDNLRFVGSFEYDYVGSRTTAPYGETIALNNVNDFIVHLPGYGIANLRYGVQGEQWGVTAFVTNLFNKEALLDTQPQINIQGSTFTRYTVNQPRTIGFDLTYYVGR